MSMSNKPTYQELEQKITEIEKEVIKLKQANVVLRESEELFSITAEETGQLLYYFNPETGRVKWTGAIEELTGYTQEEYRTFNVDAWAEQIHPDDQKMVIKTMDNALKFGTRFDAEYRFRRKDGTYIFVEEHGAFVSGSKSTSTIYPTVGTISNITKRKQAEKKINERDEKLRAILAAVPDLMIVLDSEGRYIDIFTGNPYLLIAPADELLGRTIHEVMPVESAQPIQDVIDRTLNTRESQYYEYDLGKGNNKKWFSCRSVAFKYQDLDSVLWAARDITNRKQAESERQKMEVLLQRSQKMESIGILASGIAHDFNNILSPIIGYTEMLMEDLADNPVANNNLKSILVASNRARNLVQQILTFSRENIKEYKPLKTQTIIKETLKLLRSSIPATIEITQDIDNNCRPVMGNSTQIHQIIMNLCINAYHAMENTEGKLDVKIAEVELGTDDVLNSPNMKLGRYARLSVSDTGHGITSDNLKRIFDPYFTTKEPGKGTGMGLSIIHGILKCHGGDIRVFSEPGKGTVFHVLLPLIETDVFQAKTELPEKVIGGEERILLVDDEEQIVLLIKQILERLGYQVTALTSSVDALSGFCSQPEKFDIVITDMTMPTMSGDQLAQKIIEIRSDIPVILFTGFSERINKEKAKAIGVQALVMKPIVTNEFAKTIRTILDQKKKENKSQPVS